MYCDRCGHSSTRGAILREVREAIVGGVEAVPEGQGTGQVSGILELMGSGRWAGAAEFADAGDALDD